MTKFKPDRRNCLTSALAAALAAACLPAAFWPATAQAPSRTIRIVALGDSLSAGYGLPPAAAFPNVLERVLKAGGLNVTVENAGVSGDTASGGRDRVDWSVPDGTDLVILELGANDMLRGIDPKITEAALDETVSRLRARKIAVLLTGMVAPPNNGPEYARAFNGIFPRLAARHGLPLYPFFLDGVAGIPRLNLPDGIHPTAAGVEEIVRRIRPVVEQTIARLPK